MATKKENLATLKEMGVEFPSKFEKAKADVLADIVEAAQIASEDSEYLEIRKVTEEEAAEDPTNFTEGEWVLVAGDAEADESDEDEEDGSEGEDDDENDESDADDASEDAEEDEDEESEEDSLKDVIASRPKGSYVALSNVKHNGEVYERGDVIPSGEITKNQAAPLVRDGILAG